MWAELDVGHNCEGEAFVAYLSDCGATTVPKDCPQVVLTALCASIEKQNEL